jgi:hypothetical protein
LLWYLLKFSLFSESIRLRLEDYPIIDSDYLLMRLTVGLLFNFTSEIAPFESILTELMLLDDFSYSFSVDF